MNKNDYISKIEEYASTLVYDDKIGDLCKE